ncbi:MAG TPA: hypothetical protein VJV78_38360 [Polyangiales bacterium]|nr:hypothetical protein [Polyangiales bacterium]
MATCLRFGLWTCLLLLLLEARVRAQEADKPPPDAADGGVPDPARAAEEAEIAAELGKIQTSQPPAAAPPPPPSSAESSGAPASAHGLSNLMNPAISAAGSVYGGYTTRKDGTQSAPDDLRTGITLQEVELRASAIVDPYFRADVTLSGNTEEIGFEEAFVSTLEIPHVTLRAGQMKAAVGRHNLLHTHAYPFITAPLPWRALLGPEGFNDPGISAEVLLPLPFYTELTAQAFAGQWLPLEGSETMDVRKDRDLAYVGHLKTLFDFGDSTTLEFGVSYVGGRNGFGGVSHVLGADFTLKWKPVEAERYTGFEWSTEYLFVDRGEAPGANTRGGGYTSLRFQFAQRWWVQARGALLGIPDGDEPQTLRGEALVAFVPSEFSTLRLQYAIEHEEDADDLVHEIFAQVVFSIGPHPAHAY